MKIERFNAYYLSVLMGFIDELEKELEVKFRSDVGFCSMRLRRFNKTKIESFPSPMMVFNSEKFNLCFIPYSDSTVELFSISVSERGKGFGSKLLEQIIEVSNRTGVIIKLIPLPFDVDSNNVFQIKRRLQFWYESFGFIKPKNNLYESYYTYYPSRITYKLAG